MTKDSVWPKMQQKQSSVGSPPQRKDTSRRTSILVLQYHRSCPALSIYLSIDRSLDLSIYRLCVCLFRSEFVAESRSVDCRQYVR